MSDETERTGSFLVPRRFPATVTVTDTGESLVLSRGATTLIVGFLLVVYWASVLTAFLGVRIPLLRPLSGLLLLVVVPGVLLYSVFDRTDRFGEFILFVTGLGLIAVSVLLISLQWSLGRILDPLTLPVLSVGLTVAVAALVGLTTRAGRSVSFPRISVRRTDVLVAAALGVLPILAVAAAYVRLEFQQNALMYLLAVVIVLAVLAYRVLSERHYPLIIGSIALAALLHRNLALPSLVGADVQEHYFLAANFQETGHWHTLIGEQSAAVTIVTAAPTVFSTVMGVDLVTVFTVIYPAFVALVPVGIYYLVRTAFGAVPAYVASLVFLFYHGSFYFTPGKEHVAELFIILTLLVLLEARTDVRTKLLALVFGFGIVQSHYAVTFMFVLAMGVLSALFLLAPGIDRSEANSLLGLPYAGILLTLALAWYGSVAPAMLDTLLMIPGLMLEQVGHAIALEFEHLGGGTGAGMVGEQTLLERVVTGLYVVLIVLAGVGLVSRGWQDLWQGSSVESGHLVALAVPLYAFVGVSFVAIPYLDADRVFQISLVLLAPFVVLGYRAIYGWYANGWRSVSWGTPPSVDWRPLLALVLVVFLINVGAVPQLVGQPTDFTFNDDVSDFAYTSDELEGAEWVAQQESENPIAGTNANETVLYTDVHTHQLFRAVIPPDTLEVHPTVAITWEDPSDTVEYVVIRERAVGDAPGDVLTESERNEIAADDRTEEVFDNGEIQIYEFTADDDDSAT